MPLYWDCKGPMFCSYCYSGSSVVTKTFHSWAASLRPEGDALLRQPGLSLDWISKAVSAGKIYGYIETAEQRSERLRC